MLYRKRIDDHSTRDRLGWRITPQDEAIAMYCNHRRFQPQLRETTTSRFYLRTLLQHTDATQHFRRPDVKPNSRTRTHSARSARQNIDPNIDNLRWSQTPGLRKHHPALDLRGINAREIHCRSLSRMCFVNGLVMHLQATHAHVFFQRQQLELITFLDLPGDERAGDDRSKSFHRKCTINWQTRREISGSRRDTFSHLDEPRL